MKNEKFCHLHVHDQYSLLDGYGSSEQYIRRAKELGFRALGLTNHGNIDGLIKFQKECDKNKIVPVSGCECYIVPDLKSKVKGEKRGHVTLLIKDQQGFENLCKMLTIANLQGFYHRPRIDYDLLYDHCEGLIILTGCSFSFLTLPGGEDLYLDLRDKIPGNLYLEVMPHIIAEQRIVNKICSEMAELKVPLVATNDCHYVREDDWKAQEVLLAIQTKALWSDKDRYRFSMKGLFLRSADEMINQFIAQDDLDDAEVKEAMISTMDIAEACGGFRIKKQEIYLPAVPQYKDAEPGEFIWGIAEKRLDEISKEWTAEKYNQYFDRLLEEWELINQKKFASYFMIIWELIQYCQRQGIMTGPGRGSAAGCLLAYLLGITAVDPLKFGLLFSRFISDERNDLPDVDIDFEDHKRHMIREHLEELYGGNNISSISTFLTMKGKGALRDVARVFDVPLREVDVFAKVIDAVENEEGIIAKAVENTPEGRDFNDKYPEVVDLAIKLEGQIRGSGQHAAGVVVSADNLTQGTRGNLVMRSGNIVSNWDMPDSEHVGLMKLDVLGLNTLSILNETKRLMKGQLDFEKIPLDDPAVYKEIAAGHNVGVFQLSAWATSKLATQAKADTFSLLSDVVALVRPGPADSGMCDDYLKRRSGEGWQKKHPIYEEITKDTYGIIIYQEQVMQVINKVAGLSYSTADKIRKIIGKKRDAREFKQFKDAFVQGCLDCKTLSEKEALEFWEALQAHANYSFNKSHSVAYAMIGYWTAYLKYYFPNEFLCACLTYGADGKKDEIIEECYRLGLKLQLPKVGISDAFKWVVKENILYVPFIEIKGVGEKTALDCTLLKKKKAVKGFFNIQAQESGGKLEKLLMGIGAFGQEPTEKDLSMYFSFRVK